MTNKPKKEPTASIALTRGEIGMSLFAIRASRIGPARPELEPVLAKLEAARGTLPKPHPPREEPKTATEVSVQQLTAEVAHLRRELASEKAEKRYQETHADELRRYRKSAGLLWFLPRFRRCADELALEKAATAKQEAFLWYTNPPYRLARGYGASPDVYERIAREAMERNGGRSALYYPYGPPA